MTDICITGIGAISAIGRNTEQNLESLLRLQYGIAPVRHLKTSHKGILVGEVDATDPELASLADLRSSGYPDRTTLLGIIAAREALKQSGLIAGRDTALISSTSVGGMCYSELHYHDFLTGKEYPDFIATHDGGASTFAIASALNIRGLTDSISTACSSSANAIMHACNLIRSGRCSAAIAGGTDALSLFTLNGFHSLMILDKEWCRPFDETRAGLNLGEGAAYLMLESQEHAMERKARVLARIRGYSNANDAFHQTASSPEGIGATLAMKGTLEMAGINPQEVDYINAHGTATINNDQSESAAIRHIFGDQWPAFSSTKAYTGHTLAACGSLEAVFSVLSLQNQILFPNLNFKTPMAGFNQKPVSKITRVKKLNYILSNSFGFGGNCTSLLFSKNQ